MGHHVSNSATSFLALASWPLNQRYLSNFCYGSILLLGSISLLGEITLAGRTINFNTSVAYTVKVNYVLLLCPVRLEQILLVTSFGESSSSHFMMPPLNLWLQRSPWVKKVNNRELPTEHFYSPGIYHFCFIPLAKIVTETNLMEGNWQM